MKSSLLLFFAAPALALPPEFELSNWAEPFDVEYPTALTAAADGTVYVSVDYNGSLGKEKNMGKIVSCRDTNGDGKADSFKDFVPNVDSPRGGHFVGDTLYLIHPPFLSSFRDTTGDGVADEHKVLLENIGFGLRHPRGSDHTTNGCRMGIDGWLYIAVGDFGMEDTQGTDGKVVRLHGGGVARVRPDGTELEVYSYNTRNICDVAISPTLDLFTRDNTNDGKGWNIRVHHFTNGSDHGYPRLYKNFIDEAVKPMLDLGGGSGTGALYLAEPGLPEMFLNCDWTTGKIYHDALTEKGADFKAEESIFLDLVRAVDIDVDGSSNLYVCDWRDGRFKFAGKGKKVGMLQKIVKKGLKAPPLPKFAKLSNAQLVALHKDPSAVRRLEAQRELLSRKDFKDVEGLIAVVGDKKNSKASRVAAIFTIAQLKDDKVIENLKACGLAAPNLGEFVLRALGDRKGRLDKVSPETFSKLLGSSSPRLQLQAVIGLMRLGQKASGSSEALINLATVTNDERIKHTCIQALVAIAEIDVLLKNTDHAVALQALQRLHNPSVISSLIAQLATSKNKMPLFGALARLYHKEGPWDLKFWWGTRPDDRGPYFFVEEWSETPAIKKALETAFSEFKKDDQMQALGLLGRNRIDVTKLDLGDQDPVDLALMAALPNPSQVQLLTAAAKDTKRPWDVRVAALRNISNAPDGKGIANEIGVLGNWMETKIDPANLEREISEFTNRGGLFLQFKDIRKIAAKGSVHESRVAWRSLLTMTESPLVKQGPKGQILKMIAKNPREEGFFLALADLRMTGFDKQIENAINSDNDTLIEVAKHTKELLAKAKASGGKTVDKVKPAEVSKLAMTQRGDVANGKALYLRQGCIACHAIDQKAEQKGPYLGSAGSKFTRDYLIQSVLDPNAVVAQGFQTELITTNDKKVHMGFVTKEEDGVIDLRNIAGIVTKIKEVDIKKRDHQTSSMMPPGLASTLTVGQFTDLIEYLVSLKE